MSDMKGYETGQLKPRTFYSCKATSDQAFYLFFFRDPTAKTKERLIVD